MSHLNVEFIPPGLNLSNFPDFDSIAGSFSMSAFLQALSDSFIFTGWKYAKYETWAVEKEYWPTSPSQAPSGTLTANPLVSTSSIWSAILNQNPGSFVYAVKATKNDVLDAISSASAYYSNGGIAFSTVTINSNGKTVRRYSWENALNAYRTLGELYTIAVAIEKGNSNPELWGLAREKYDELEKYMKVRLVSTSFTPNPVPPKPSPMPIPLDISTPSLPKTSSTTTQTPVFKINAIRVVRTTRDSNPIKYHVLIDYTVTGGQVVVYNVTFNTGSEEQTITPGILDPGSGTIESGNFTAPVGVLDGSLKVKVGGIVTVTYRPVVTPDGGSIIIKSTSAPASIGEPSISGYSDDITAIRVIKLEYTGTFDLISQLDPEKVKVKVIPSKDVAEVGDSITFKLRIKNGNTLPIRGYYTLYAQVPDGPGKRTVKLGGDRVTLGANKETEITVSTVPYSEPGRYEYFAVFSYAGLQATDRGSVLVQREDDPGKVYIEGVEVNPDLPKEYETVNFTVTLGNTYPTAEDLKIALYIDGRVVDEKNVGISANSENKVVLRWSSAEKGDHSYRIEVNRTLGNVNLGKVDTYSGNITAFDGDFGVSFTVWPRTLDGGGKVWFTVKVRNYRPDKLDVRGFIEDEDGAVIVKMGGSGVYTIPARREKSFSFSYTVYGVANHTFKLFIDNTDGKPNGNGEEHWDEGTMEVNPVGNIIANMSCKPAVISYTGSTSCRITLLNQGDSDVAISVASVDFGTLREVWNGANTKGINVDLASVVLPPNDDKTIVVHIDLEGLAQTIWGDKYYARNFLEHESYMITVNFDNIYPVSDTVSVFYEESSIEKHSRELGSIIGGFIGGVIAGAITEGSATEEGIVTGAALGAILGDKISSGVVSILDFFIDISNFKLQDIPNDSVQDNNSVNGG
ncbi:hypothetical protein TAM4_1258 [Thermococcus sp. AM4]|nr:hypothetical protein TAM4_1258 [Thermococcus sp. AM4]